MLKASGGKLMTNYCGFLTGRDKEEFRERTMKKHYHESERLEVIKDDWDKSYLKPKDKKWEKPVSKEEWDKGLDSLIVNELTQMYALMTEEEKLQLHKFSCSAGKDKETNE